MHLKTLPMALKNFRRDWRSGEVRVLFFALMIAVAAMTAIGVITDRIQRSMGEQASEFLGADYVISSPRQIPEDWLTQAQKQNLATSVVQGISTVLSKADKFQLVSVKVLKSDYPLKGELEISQAAFVAGEKLQGKPQAGFMWVEPRVLSLLEAKVGDKVEFGATELTISGVIVSGPGQASEVFNVAPGIMVNAADVASAQIIQAGSRVSNQLLIRGEPQLRDQYIQWLKPQLNDTQRITGGKEGTPALQASISRAESFLRLASLVSVVLAGVAIAVAAGRFSRRHFDYAAIYRCLGMQVRQVHQLYLWQLGLMGLIGVLLGLVIGFLIQEVIIWRFADFLPKPMVAVSLVPALVAVFSGLVVLLGFALPSFFQIAKVPPLRVLRKELAPAAVSSWVIYLLAIGAMALLMWWQSDSWLLVGILLLVSIIAFAVIRLFAWFIFKIGLWLGKRSPTAVRFGLGQLKRYPAFTISQITAFGLAFMIMLSTYLIRTELLSEWQSQMPDDAPNHFLVNVQNYEVSALDTILQENQIVTSGIYPMVRGRVTKLNGELASEVLSKEEYQQARALRRELNLTWMETLPNANSLVEGVWWDQESSQQLDPDAAKISISTEIQEMMKVKIGDKVSFDIGGLSVEGQIANVREIQWDSFQPNFFVIFEPKGLKDFPASYITSFHLEADQKPILNQILSQMPTVTIIELDKIMAQVQKILDQVTLAIEFIMLFVLLAGVAVLYAVLQANREERVLSATLLKTLGAQSPFIRTSLIAELALLGIFSGMVAVIASEILVSSVYINVLELGTKLHPLYWFLVPIAAAIFVGLAGWFGVKSILKQPATKVLRQA
ncbi:ABC transporter permease [Kangiella sp. TOML190]|uniref:ABC transporter permease n=1 Tax=Kangiella sp. TOML190 TaxID=2931351 RepID=UPI002040D42B|nr:FtsX-like permease family protein [Kangiella sp. TOML190]